MSPYGAQLKGKCVYRVIYFLNETRRFKPVTPLVFDLETHSSAMVVEGGGGGRTKDISLAIMFLGCSMLMPQCKQVAIKCLYSYDQLY